MSLVFQLIVELPQFGSSITSLLIDPLAAFITHLLLLSCVHILTLDSFKDTQQQMWWWWKHLFLSPVSGSYPLFFFHPTRRLTVLLIPSDQFVVEIRNQERRVIPFPHGFRHLWHRAASGHFTITHYKYETLLTIILIIKTRLMHIYTRFFDGHDWISYYDTVTIHLYNTCIATFRMFL